MMFKTFRIYVYKHPEAREDVQNVDVFEFAWRYQSLRRLYKTYAIGDCRVLIDGVEVDEKHLRGRVGLKVKKIEFIPKTQFWAAVWGGVKAFGVAVWNAIPGIVAGFMWSYAGGQLFNQGADEVDRGNDPDANYGWNPQLTSQQGTSRPRLYGEFMVHGNATAKWTDVDESGNEILYMIVDHGEGPFPDDSLGSNIVYIEDQPIGNFPTVTVQECLGTMSQTCMTGFEKDKIEYSYNRDLTEAEGWVTFSLTNNFIDDIETTIAFPNGLIQYRKDGSTEQRYVGFQIQVSEAGLGSWTTIYNDSIIGQQLTTKYENIKFSEHAPSGFAFEHGKAYDIRYKRTAPDAEERKVDACIIKSVRVVIDTAFRRPGRALLGLTAIATNTLSGDMDVKCVRKGRVINVYDGTNWNIEWSQNRAWVTFDVLTLPVISGTGTDEDPYVIERYDGLDPSNIDIAFFYEWAEFCDDAVSDGKGSTHARFVCNYNVDRKTNIMSLAFMFAQVARAKLFWEGTTLTGWLDKAVTSEVDLVTCDNMMARSWKNSYTQPSELAGTINVYYKDEDDGYERTFYPYADADSGSYTRAIDVESTGETRWAAVVRDAVFRLDRNRLIRNVNEFRMHKDAMRYSLGNVLRIQSRVPNWGRNYRVNSVVAATKTITFDRSVEASVGDLLYVRAFSGDVVVNSYTVASVSGSSVVVSESIIPVPVKDDIAAIASSSGTCTTVLRRIIKIGQSVNNFYDITVETYTTDLFTHDSLDPSKPNALAAWPSPVKSRGLQEKVVNWQNIIDLVSTVLPPQPDIEVPWLSNVDWDVVSGGTLTWTATDADDDITFRYRGTTYAITADSTTDSYVYWDSNYTTIFRTTNDLNTAIASGNWVVAVLKDGVVYPAPTPMQIIWGGLILAGTIRAESYAELRQTPQIIDGDSCDATNPFVMDFKIPEETTSIISISLSFKIREYRAYSTAAASGGGATSTASGGNWTDLETTGPSDWGWFASTGEAGGATGGVVGTPSGATDTEDLGTHYHTMPSHNHSLGVPGDTDATNLGSHIHTMGTHEHNITGDTDNEYLSSVPGSHSHSLSAINVDCSLVDPGDTNSTNLNTHSHGIPASINWTISSVDPGDTNDADLGTHAHDFDLPAHTHSIGSHTHSLSEIDGANHIHTLNISGHTHVMGEHTHGVTYGIHEELNATTINIYCNNGTGYGSSIGSYGADQTDLDITSNFDSTGWKSIRFTSTARARIKAILEMKFDITA